MIRRVVLVVVVAALGAIGVTAPPASAGVSACYSISVTVNGDAVVNQAECQAAP